MSTMSPPASAMAWAMLATIPRRFLPVVVTTARGPRRRASSAQEAQISARARACPAGDGAVAVAVAPLATVASAATSRVTSATRRRRRSSTSRFTVDLHAIDDGDDGGVDGNVRLGPGRQLLADRDPRRMTEGDQHVVTRPGVQRVGADDQI